MLKFVMSLSASVGVSCCVNIFILLCVFLCFVRVGSLYLSLCALIPVYIFNHSFKPSLLKSQPM